MVITDVRRQRRHLYELVIDGEPAVTVDVSVWDESPYKAVQPRHCPRNRRRSGG